MILVNKDLRQRIDSCWALRHMEQMRSLLADPLFLPGDFVIDGAPAVSLVEQVMSGMKLFPVQNRLLETYEEYGGAELLDDMPRMLAWMLNAVIQESAAGISPECLEAHGDPGPIAFLLQLDAISAKSPYPGAVELPLHASKPYYMTLAPTARLEKLREGMRGLSRDISSAEDYLRRNAELCDVLMASLTNVSLDYTAPLLSRKLVHLWARASDPIDWAQLSVGDLIGSGMADQKDGLQHFDPRMPMSVLQDAYQGSLLFRFIISSVGPLVLVRSQKIEWFEFCRTLVCGSFCLPKSMRIWKIRNCKRLCALPAEAGQRSDDRRPRPATDNGIVNIIKYQ